MGNNRNLSHLTDVYINELQVFQKTGRLKKVISTHSKISFVQNYNYLNKLLKNWNIELVDIKAALLESTELLQNHKETDAFEEVLAFFDKAFYDVYTAYSTDMHYLIQFLAQKAYIGINSVAKEADLKDSERLRIKKVLNALKLNPILAVKQDLDGVTETLPAHLRIKASVDLAQHIQDYLSVIGSLVQLTITDLEKKGSIARLEKKVYGEMFGILDSIFSQEDVSSTKYLLEDANGDLYNLRTKLTKPLLEEALKGGWLYSESGKIVSVKILDKKIVSLESNFGQVVNPCDFS